MTLNKNKLLEELRTRRDDSERAYRSVVHWASGELPDGELSDLALCVESLLLSTGRTIEDLERDVNTFLQRN